ncbi:secreted RxLR effector peptide protein, putative [Phytophthora infestans T30-4]
MRPISLVLLAASISAICSALSEVNGGDTMMAPALVSSVQARPLNANHNIAIGNTRYLRAQPSNQEDEDRSFAVLEKITTGMLDDILSSKSIEAQSKFLSTWKEVDLPVEVVAKRILEIAPADEKYLTILTLYMQFLHNKPLSAIYKHDPLEFAKINDDFPSWRAWLMSVLKK